MNSIVDYCRQPRVARAQKRLAITYTEMAASNTLATRTKTSKVWEHFSLDTANKKITCKVCKAELAYHGSTSVMHEHLKRKHVGQLNETESDSPR
ncbi:hypothetical protein PAMP_005409 [Pampus punctatissimus]